MKTGYFAKHGNIPGAISISISSPKFFHGSQYRFLAPRWEMLKMSRDDYDRHYILILRSLSPKKVYDDLVKLGKNAEPVLLCWEKPNTWCHRRLVAEWLEMFLKVEISEYGFARQDVFPYKTLR
jgi:hypothetical protein